jgi:hypothetical protein
MKFPYIRHEVERTHSTPNGEVYRPEIPIRIIGPGDSVLIAGLLDTGADHVFLSTSLAELLGIEVDHNQVESAEGAGGHELVVWPGTIEFELTDGRDVFLWARVGFLAGDDDPTAAYLGHLGFLEYFELIFDGNQRAVELIANDDLALAMKV